MLIGGNKRLLTSFYLIGPLLTSRFFLLVNSVTTVDRTGSDRNWLSAR